MLPSGLAFGGTEGRRDVFGVADTADCGASQLTSGSHLVYPKALDSDIAGSGGLTTGMGAIQLRGGERCLPQSPSCPP